MESKGYERSKSPDFYISIFWDTISDEILYKTGFIVAGKSKTGFFGYWSEKSSLYFNFYKHSLVISIHNPSIQKQIWRIDTQIASISSDIRYSANTMFKNAVYRFPSIGQNIRNGITLNESTLSDKEKFRKYVEEYIYKRDFSFPGFEYYVTFSPKQSLNSFAKSVRNLSKSPQYFPLYIDLLEYGVYYHTKDSKKLNLLGIYKADGETIYIKIRAKKSVESSKFTVSSLEIVDRMQYDKDIEIIREIELNNIYLHNFFN